MSTPEIPSVNFLVCFVGDSITQRHGRWKSASRPCLLKIALFAPRAMRFALCPDCRFTLCWQIALGGQLGPAVATALFALSLPMQGLWWLGKRSVTPLPPSILHWFYEVRGKLEEAGGRWHRLRVSRTIRRWRISSSVRLNSLIKHSSMTCD